MSEPWITQEVPPITNHAHEQFADRSNCCTLSRAWKDGLVDPRLVDYVDGVDARYHEPSETIPVVNTEAITTVLDAECIANPALRRIVNELRTPLIEQDQP